MKRARVWAGCTTAALLAHALAGRWLADRDLVLALLTGAWGWALPLVAVLLATRLFLYLLAPGWALHVAVTLLVERRRTRRRHGDRRGD